MWKDAVRALETGTLGEIALIAFFTAFVLIVLYALTLPKEECDDALELPLDDPTSIGGDGQ
jgi:cbb3-type cytochrome oxidase subunit 3